MTGSWEKRYLLVVLTSLSACNFVDRWALGLVLQDIKVDLGLTDTQLGFLSGIAFALFYSLMGIPIARWADRGNRVAIIALTAGIWSVAVAACGLATGFMSLLLVRVAVAVGEAGGFIPGYSLVGDYFNRAERARAVAIYSMAAGFSIIIGYWLAGWLNELYGWRVMFMWLGAPGLLLGALVWFTLKEPRNEKRRLAETAQQPTLKEVCVTLSRNVTFRHMLFSLSATFFFMYGVLQWQPTFFIRSYGLTSGELGIWFAVLYGVGGLLGTYFGGTWASRYAAHNERLQLKAVAVALLCAAVLSTCIYLSHSHYVAFSLMGWVMFGLAVTNGPFFGTIQTLVPERMRAMAAALVLMFANLIGMGLGPLATGALSDALRPWTGDESLRYALLILAPGYLWAAWHAWRASQTVMRDVSSSLNLPIPAMVCAIALSACANAHGEQATVSVGKDVQTGLDFPGSAATEGTIRFRFTKPLAIYPATYLWKLYPRSQPHYYTTFFWGNDGRFDWDTTGVLWWKRRVENTYYGAHPYPYPAPNYAPPGGVGPRYWEISVDGLDVLSKTEVEYNRWHTQALRVWADESGKHHEFYWDLPDMTRVITHVVKGNYGEKYPPSPALTWGDAPWNPSNEIMDGVIRGIQIYSAVLSAPEVLAEAGSPRSSSSGNASLWYLNLNPTPTDISDHSGAGHHPEWVGPERPKLWQSSDASR